MSTSAKAQQVYDESVAELNQMLASFSATPEQKAAAQKALNTLATRYGATLIDQVESRTALLNSLVSELNTVIAEVRLNPIGHTLDTFNSLVQTTNAIMQEDRSGSV